MDKNKKGFKRETIPIIVALTILIVLIIALVYTIMYKPKNNEVKNVENTLAVEEMSVGTSNYVCEGKDINQVKEEASKVYLTYEDVEKYYIATEKDPDMSGDDLEDIYVSAMRIKIYGITDNIYVSVQDAEFKDKKLEFYKEDVKDSFAKYEKVNTNVLSEITVRIFVDDDNCKNMLLREFTVKLPRLNTFYGHPRCEEEVNKDKEVCKKYVFNNNSYDTDMQELLKDSKKDKKEDKKENKKVSPIVYVVVIVMMAGLVGVIFMKGRKKHE